MSGPFVLWGKRMDEYTEILGKDPGNPVFAEYAEELRAGGERTKALEVCLAGLTANPSCPRGRLVLARVYYELGFFPFAQRELDQLSKEMPDSKLVAKLIERLREDSGGSPSAEVTGAKQEVVADVEVDIGDLDQIEVEIDKKH